MSFPQIPIPDKVNMAWLAVDKWVEAGIGKKTALFFQDRTISFEQLQEMANRFGNAVIKLGLNKGDRVVFRLPNSPEYYAAVLGCMKVGVITSCTATLFGPREMVHVLNNSDAVAAVSMPSLVDTIDQVRNESQTLKHIITMGGTSGNHLSYEDLVKEASSDLKTLETGKDDPAFIFYTSGTTGQPKGILHHHRWLIGTGDPIVKYWMQATPSDVIFCPNEISHSYPFGASFFQPLYVGAASAVYQGRVTPEGVLDTIQRHGVTILAGVPTLYRLILAIPEAEKKWDLKSVKLFMTAGETMLPPLYEDLKQRFGVEAIEGWGGSESHATTSNIKGVYNKVGSIGKPFPGKHVKIFDDAGKELPPGEVGHIGIREDDPGLFVDYLKMREIWDASHRNGYFFYGDMGYMDEEGFFWYMARADDLIKSRGYNVSPKEVEDTIVELPFITEVGVVGAPDDVMGQRVKAFVVLGEGTDGSKETAQEIAEHVRARIAAYKTPKNVEFLKELPRMPGTGKIIRRELKNLEKERYGRQEKQGFEI
ncbi:MAG: acyl-CoA synthetase [Nitrososphaerales archaeon]